MKSPRSFIRIALVNFQLALFPGAQRMTDNVFMLPLGLMSISAYVKSKIIGAKIKLFGSFIDFSNKEQLNGLLSEFNPNIIGIRCLSKDVEGLLMYVRYIRSHLADDQCLIVVGGPAASANTEELKDSRLFDFIVVGEGETAFLEIVDAQINGRIERVGGNGALVRGMVCRKDFIDDIDTLPFPDYDIIDYEKYSQYFTNAYNHGKTAALFTSRGCPYQCAYCHNIFGKKARLRSAENVFSEIKHLYGKYHFKSFGIWDDIFNVDYDRAMKIFDLIINSKLKINLYFTNGIRGDMLDEHYIDKMVEAGTIFISYSIETASSRLQKLVRKYLDLDKLKNNIIYTCNKGIMVKADFMFGLPSETEKEALETLRYVESLDKLNLPVIFFTRYYPHTDLYAIAKKSGFTEDMLRFSTKYHYHEIDNYFTPTLSKESIQYIKNYYLYNILLNKKRIMHMLEIWKKFYSVNNIVGMINAIYHINIKSLSQFLSYVDAVQRAK